MNDTDPQARRLYLFEGRALYLGQAFDTDLHAHHALQICVALEGDFHLSDASGARLRCRCAVVAPDFPHLLDGGTSLLALAYLDPQSEDARTLTQAGPACGIGPWDSVLDAGTSTRLRECLTGGLAPSEVLGRLRDLLATLVGTTEPPPRSDERVAKALSFLAEHKTTRLRLSEVAAHVALSPSRFAHLFREQTGLPLRRYLLWMRLQRALAALAEGASLTEAAHAAEFSDSAHLSRTFRSMFGITPSSLLKDSRFVQDSTEIEL